MTRDEMLDQREDVLEEFDDKVDPSHGPLTMTLGELRWFTAQLLADEIVRLRKQSDELDLVWTEQVHKARTLERILDALREPSEAVMDAVWDLQERVYPKYVDYDMVVRTAVAAAEKEVSTAHGLTKRVLDVVQSGERGEPLPPIREAMDALMTEANDDPR